jgi:hypothetical protein
VAESLRDSLSATQAARAGSRQLTFCGAVSHAVNCRREALIAAERGSDVTPRLEIVAPLEA